MSEEKTEQPNEQPNEQPKVMKKVKLKEQFGMIKDTGEFQDYFGVPFVCKNEKVEGNKFLSVWTAEVEEELAKEMVKARRVDLVK